MRKLPFLHKIAFIYSWYGLRGSQVVWKFAFFFVKPRDGKLIHLPNGFPLLINSRDWIAKTVYEGTYERTLLRFLNTLKIDNVVVDIGANIGTTTWHAIIRVAHHL